MERTKEQIERMTLAEIAAAFRRAAEFERTHVAVTWEHGNDLVNMVALHGDQIAAALTHPSHGSTLEE